MNGNYQRSTNLTFAPPMIDKVRATVSRATGSGNQMLIFIIVLLLHFVNVGIPFVFDGFRWFNGLNMAFMAKTPEFVGKILYAQIITNVTFWMVVALIFLFARGKNWEENSSMLLMVTAFFRSERAHV